MQVKVARVCELSAVSKAHRHECIHTCTRGKSSCHVLQNQFGSHTHKKRTLYQLNPSESESGDSSALAALSIAGLSTATDAASSTAVLAAAFATRSSVGEESVSRCWSGLWRKSGEFAAGER